MIRIFILGTSRQGGIKGKAKWLVYLNHFITGWVCILEKKVARCFKHDLMQAGLSTRTGENIIILSVA